MVGYPSQRLQSVILNLRSATWTELSLDGRLAQYALGIVLYEMLSGATPFQGESMEALFVHHRYSPMPALPASLGVPGAVERVIRRATEKTTEAKVPVRR